MLPFEQFVALYSDRQLMVMDETHVVNQMKEDTCYVSTDFWGDMEIAKYVTDFLSSNRLKICLKLSAEIKPEMYFTRKKTDLVMEGL